MDEKLLLFINDVVFSIAMLNYQNVYPRNIQNCNGILGKSL